MAGKKRARGVDKDLSTPGCLENLLLLVGPWGAVKGTFFVTITLMATVALVGHNPHWQSTSRTLEPLTVSLVTDDP